MKKAIVAVGFVYLLSGCEDGPTQTFKPAPNGAASKWNDGQSPAITNANVNQGFAIDTSGTNLQELCTAQQKRDRWMNIFTQPIQPPKMGAGINMAGMIDSSGKPTADATTGVKDTWSGVTVADVEAINCQSYNYDDGDNYWGDNGEVFFSYYTSTRKLYYMGFNPGYQGGITFQTRHDPTMPCDVAQGCHTYKMVVNSQISKDGAPMLIDWNGNSQAPCTVAGANGVCTFAGEIGDALFATFAPGLPAEPDCRKTGHCIIGNFGDQAYFFVPAMGFAFRVSSYTAAQPTPSTVSYFDQYLEKVLPFASAGATLKLDSEGPTGVQAGLGPQSLTCNLHLGATYADFIHDCVEVSGDAAADATEKAKLLGNLTHSTERFHFDVAGIDLNFTDRDLPDNNVIRDNDQPSDNDTATDFDVDQSSLGVIINDYTQNNTGLAKDLHMTGLIYAEYAALVQQAINKFTPAGQQHQIGDDQCLPGVGGSYPAGCTGFEGFAIPTNAVRVDDVDLAKQAKQINATGSGADYAALSTLRAGMKPGHQQAVFCDGVGVTQCATAGDIFVTSFNRVLKVWAHGDPTNLPPEMKDNRFYFRLWSSAFFKFLLAEKANGSTLWSDVHNAPINYDDIFFDSIGAGQFEISEYIDRRFVSATQDPTDVVITADVKNGIVNDYDFGRDLLRGETGLLLATRQNVNDPLGKEGSLLTNLFGSPVVTAGWSNEGTGKSAYQCATDVTGALGCTNPPPMDFTTGLPMLDDNGNPIMAKYLGAFSATGTVFKLGGTSPLAITTSDAFSKLEAAQITIPIHQDTYNTMSPVMDMKTFLVPWLPKQPGIGFPIALSGTRDKFVSTAVLDMSGLTETANLDYDLADPENPSAGITVKAVETTDFLGYIFVCMDGNTRDLLAVKMYTPVAHVLDWINAHPNAVNDCGMIIRYSPYNNFPDYITSLTNGVRLGITQGGGFGRVVDVTLFAPGQ